MSEHESTDIQPMSTLPMNRWVLVLIGGIWRVAKYNNTEIHGFWIFEDDFDYYDLPLAGWREMTVSGEDAQKRTPAR